MESELACPPPWARHRVAAGRWPQAGQGREGRALELEPQAEL